MKMLASQNNLRKMSKMTCCSLSSKTNLDKWPDFSYVLLPVLGEECGKLAFLNHAMRIVCFCEFGHLKQSDCFRCELYFHATLRAHAFSTGPSCTSWSSTSPMFTFGQMHWDNLFVFFWKVMERHYFTTNTIVYVNKHSFENHSNYYVIINTINNLVSCASINGILQCGLGGQKLYNGKKRELSSRMRHKCGLNLELLRTPYML